MKQQPTRLKITIPEPCHERWDKMTPTEKGAYCQSCEKEVMDFSGLQQDDIAYYFKHKDTGKTCGRFTKAQLNQTYIIPSEPAPRRTWMRALWLLPLTLLSKNVFGQERKPPVCEKPQTETTGVPQTDSIEMMLGQGIALPDDTVIQPQQQNRLTGHVRNAATGAALPLAVIIVNDSLQTTTDSTGNFVLPLPEDFAVDSFIVTLEGFSGKYVPLKGDSVAGVRDIKLEPLFTWQAETEGVTIPLPGTNYIIISETTLSGCISPYYEFGTAILCNMTIKETEGINSLFFNDATTEYIEPQKTITHPEMLPGVPLHPVKTSTEHMGNANEEPLPETPLQNDEPKQQAMIPPALPSRKKKK